MTCGQQSMRQETYTARNTSNTITLNRGPGHQHLMKSEQQGSPRGERPRPSTFNEIGAATGRFVIALCEEASKAED